ncbi:MAG: hypothetical protein DMG34_08180 [Acidobacteria bacterium]|nr:MAG: hypothetical protein DMG34_08180 [Acidobacteriota bacterium]
MPLKLTSLLLAGALLVAGCSRKAVISVDRAETASYTRVSGLASSTRALFTHSLSAVSDSSHRFTAVRHKLEIVSNEGDLPKAWESVINFCGSIQCEIIASSITARTPESSPSGSIALRVAPQDFPRLIAQAEKQGNIVQHTTETEDKTSAVVDTEAKIKNLNTYRDSLRGMLGKPSVGVKDLVEIQEKLTDVQSELDSENAQRKILANETEKVAVELNFRVQRSGANRSAFTPIWDAFRESGANLAESLATLITVVVSVIPWLVIIVPGGWLLVRFWQKLRRKRNVSAPSPSA